MASVVGPTAEDPFTATAQRALAASNLRSLRPQTKRALIASGTSMTTPAGSMLHREGSEAAHLQLVVSGLVRVYLTALDGRTLTVRYCRQGAILGAATLFSAPFTMPASVQAVTDTQILALPAAWARNQADHDIVFARALIDELSERALAFIAEIPQGVFATVRQRVARHLLDLASSADPPGTLHATISQQELADAVGSVREVVVRTLRALREEGLVVTGAEGIVLPDPERLAAEAYPDIRGTQVPPR